MADCGRGNADDADLADWPAKGRQARIGFGRV
jgi:hypothetical protein